MYKQDVELYIIQQIVNVQFKTIPVFVMFNSTNIFIFLVRLDSYFNLRCKRLKVRGLTEIVKCLDTQRCMYF